MGFADTWNKMKNKATTEVSKFKNKDFMEALCAGAAMVAFADGALEAQEKKRLLSFFENEEALKVFDPVELMGTWRRFVAEFESDTDMAELKAMREIKQVTNREQQEMLAGYLTLIAKADGEIEPAERTKLVQIFKALSVDADDYI